ncbi:hypothetical protein BTE54_16370 [Agrobacterium sp. YIC 4121]|nr:hypothetical protein BTE54_16370 [Agrobacterium sp. YIC 4121]
MGGGVAPARWHGSRAFPAKAEPLYITSTSFLCLSQESSRRASARRGESFQPKDLGWLDLCDKHRDEGR